MTSGPASQQAACVEGEGYPAGVMPARAGGGGLTLASRERGVVRTGERYRAAAALGCSHRQSVRACAELMRSATVPTVAPPGISDLRTVHTEGFQTLSLRHHVVTHQVGLVTWRRLRRSFP